MSNFISFQRRSLFLTSIFFISLLSACSEDSFTMVTAKIEVSIEPSDSYADFDEEELIIDLGEVPVYGTRTATFRIDNPSVNPLRIEKIEYDSEATEGNHWEAPTWRRGSTDTTGKLPPLSIKGAATRLIDVTYSPLQIGPASATIRVINDAGAPKILKVLATGVYVGDPEIEVSYNGLLVPDAASDCVDGVCTIGAENALNLGNIALETQGTAQITIKNIAECEPIPDGNPCSTCVLRVEPNSEHHNLGIGFKDGTNTEDKFSFETVYDFPQEIPQKDAECGNTGELKVLVKFSAPDVESDHQTTLVIENNDSDEGVIEIPITARALNAPIAIGELRGFDATNPSAPYTNADEIEPLFRVHFDGRKSYDPSLPAPDNTNLPHYHWEVLHAPQEFVESEYQWQGQNESTASMWVPIAGDYTVKLTVRNAAGIESGDTESAFVNFSAHPGSAIHIQLVWDHPTNDQDLHLVWGGTDGAIQNICHKDYDCYFTNCNDGDWEQIHWFTDVGVGTGPNPRLDRDDTNGLGPENINIDEPNPGKYRIYVHYWGGTGATVNTLRVYLNGLLRFDQHRTMTANSQVWGIGTVEWTDDGSDLGTGTFEVFQGEVGQVGQIGTMTTTDCSGTTGWAFPH